MRSLALNPRPCYNQGMRFFIFAVVMLLAFAPAARAQQACTQIGCVNGLNMHLPMNMQWPAGQYTFTVTTEKGVMSCQGSLPLPPCNDDDDEDYPAGSLRCTDKRLVVMESGCALPADAHSFGPLIQIEDSPAQVHLVITRDNIVVADQSFAPQYNTSQPNGPQCGPVCHSASVNVTATGN